MSEEQAFRFRSLEGRHVCLALSDGTRIDDCQLVSIGRHGVDSLWVYVNGNDCFVALGEVVEIWESGPNGRAA
jgi:hypothetical protein